MKNIVLPWCLLLLVGTIDHYFSLLFVNALEPPRRDFSTPLAPNHSRSKKRQTDFRMRMSMRGGATTTAADAGGRSIPTLLPPSVLAFWLDLWRSSKSTLLVFARPAQSVVLYQPPVGIVAWWVSYRWIQRFFFPNTEDPLHRVLGEFPWMGKFQTKRPKSVELDALDRDYDTLGGVQAQALRQQQQLSDTDPTAVTMSAVPPRASRFQCAKHSVESLIEQSDNNNNNSPVTVLWEVRALDSLLRCVRDNQLLPLADQLRTRQQDCETQLQIYHTSSRQWMKRTLQTILAHLVNGLKKSRLGTSRLLQGTMRHPWSLQEWRSHYQDVSQQLQEQYEQLGRLQEVLLEQPQLPVETDQNNSNSNNNNYQQHLDLCSKWSTKAKSVLQDLLASHSNNHREDVSVVQMITTSNTNKWGAEQWKAALTCVDTKHAITNSHNAAFSLWGIVTRQWKQRSIVSALLKIALAKAIHSAVLPHWPYLKTSGHQVASALWGIVEFRFYLPLKVIVMDLLNRRPRLLDPAQLVNEKTSLQNMLRDLGIPVDDETNVESLAQASRMYEQQLKNGAVKNMVFGNMVRLLLIQVQQLKAELLEAFQSIDELVDANRLNVSLLATIPAFLLVRWGSRILYALLYRFRVRDLTGLSDAHRELTSRLRTLERLLILADDGPLKGPQLGEFLSQEQKYLMLLDYCQPPFPVKQIDSIYQDMQDLLPPGGLDRETQLNLLKLIHQKNADLLKSLR